MNQRLAEPRQTALNSYLAEREGFEPPIGLRLCRISSAVLSTAQPPLLHADLIDLYGRNGNGQMVAGASLRNAPASVALIAGPRQCTAPHCFPAKPDGRQPPAAALPARLFFLNQEVLGDCANAGDAGEG